MVPLDEMKSWVGFGPEDERLLVGVWPYVEPELPRIVDVFYDKILASARARAVFEDDDQIRRQKRVLVSWVEELLTGPWDQAYAQRRQQIGRRHVEIGLEHTWMFTAMEVVRGELCDIAFRSLPHGEALATCRAISHITSIDLALMTGTYSGVRERARVASARGLLLSHLPSPAVLLDGDGTVVEANSLLEDLAGEQPRRGRPMADALPGVLCEMARLEDAIEQVRQTGRPVTRERVDLVLDGREHVLRIRVVPLDQDGSLLLHFEELTDVVDAEARARRVESLARVGELSAAIAHELRNPLAGISGAIQVLAGSFDQGDRRAMVMGKVRDQVGRLDRMVRDLLAYSRPPDARLDELALEEIVDNVLDLVAGESAEVALSREGAGMGRADADLLHRIVLNLVQNALAMPGVCSVRVRVEPGVIRVSDDGPGVPPALRDRVFEPFFTTRTTGTGLGLAICRNAAEAMGGALSLEEADRGASFLLRLRT